MISVLIGLKAGDWGLVRSWRMEIRTLEVSEVLFSEDENFFGHGLGMKKIVVIFVVSLGKIVFSKGTENFFDLGSLEKVISGKRFSTSGDKMNV